MKLCGGSMKKIRWTFIILGVALLCYVAISHPYIVNKQMEEDDATLLVTFLLPVEQQDLTSLIVVEGEDPNGIYLVSFKWESAFRVRLIVHERGIVKGEDVRLQVKGVKSKLGPTFSIKKKISFNEKPHVLQEQIQRKVGRNQPIILYFNTLIGKEDLEEALVLPFPYEIEQGYKIEETSRKSKKEYSSCWIVKPKEALEYGKSYEVFINKDLKNHRGQKIAEEYKVKFKVPLAPRLLDVNLSGNMTNDNKINICPGLNISSDVAIKKIHVEPEIFEGTMRQIKEAKNQVQLFPKGPLKPNREYQLKVSVEDLYGEKSEAKTLTFETMDIDDEQIWVEVALGEQQEVIIRRGEEEIRRMSCSGGKASTPTLLGTYYLQERGKIFFAKRFNQGAKYWVRFKDTYLFHGIPIDASGKIIEEEKTLIGKPASHGCVRLHDKDAKWFYENLPEGAMVVIHE